MIFFHPNMGKAMQIQGISVVGDIDTWIDRPWRRNWCGSSSDFRVLAGWSLSWRFLVRNFYQCFILWNADAWSFTEKSAWDVTLRREQRLWSKKSSERVDDTWMDERFIAGRSRSFSQIRLGFALRYMLAQKTWMIWSHWDSLSQKHDPIKHNLETWPNYILLYMKIFTFLNERNLFEVTYENRWWCGHWLSEVNPYFSANKLR